MFPLNVPNVLTLVRILLVPVLVVALLQTTPHGSTVAAIVFALAAVTDGVDGWIARRSRSITTFGKVMDPIADKLLIAAALISLVSLNRLDAWVAMVIIAREFAVSGLRVAAGQQGAIIPANRLGKIKTVLQVAMVLALIAANDPHAVWVHLLVYATVVVTVASGASYFLNFKKSIDEARERLASSQRRPVPPAAR
jgi:CDP-diacylglycerol---glycerol-3-phosphate 3-phosphatidyltransferase